MDTRKNPQAKPESIPEAAEKAGTVIRHLQSRLSVGTPRALDPHPDEELDQMDRDLQEAFARQEARVLSSNPLQKIRQRVADSIAERILAEWGVVQGSIGKLEGAVVDRIVERVLERLKLAEESESRQPGLRTQAVSAGGES